MDVVKCVCSGSRIRSPKIPKRYGVFSFSAFPIQTRLNVCPVIVVLVIGGQENLCQFYCSQQKGKVSYEQIGIVKSINKHIEEIPGEDKGVC